MTRDAILRPYNPGVPDPAVLDIDGPDYYAAGWAASLDPIPAPGHREGCRFAHLGVDIAYCPCQPPTTHPQAAPDRPRPHHTHARRQPVIENTSTPESREAFGLAAIAVAMSGQSTDSLVEAQEKRGQQQLIHSDRLPTVMHDPREAFESVGFTFGEPDPRDRLFAPATLPDRWKREGSDHAMWSYILDQLGRRRVSMFYKAAFYDRDAFMSLNTVYGYVAQQMRNGEPIITDDTWATPAAVVEAARKGIDRASEEIDTWTHIGNAKYVAEYTAQRDAWAAIAAAHDNA
jgi:hypothetical protein